MNCVYGDLDLRAARRPALASAGAARCERDSRNEQRFIAAILLPTALRVAGFVATWMIAMRPPLTLPMLKYPHA